MKIEIVDEQLKKGEAVLEKDVYVSITEAEEQTIKTLDEKGDVVEVVLNVAKEPRVTSLSQIDELIAATETTKAHWEQNLVQVNAELDALITRRAEVAREVGKAMEVK